MSKVIAKFDVLSVHKEPRYDEDHKLVGSIGHVNMSPVQDDIFGPHTPCGEIRMTIHNEVAVKIFEDNLGKAMMIEFIPTDEEG